MSTNVEMMKSRIWRRIIVKSVVLLLWAGCMLYIALQGDAELAASWYFYMAIMCVAVWVVTTVREARRLRDEDGLRKAAIEEADERNVLITYKATRLAVIIMACLFPIAVIVLAFQGAQETINTLAYTMCAFLVAYLGSWFYVSRKE